MTKVGGQQRQLAVDFHAGLMPVKKRVDSERMAFMRNSA
jgi:hypothetical protein